MRARAPWLLALLVLGVGWGSTQSLGKIATSTGHGHFGLIFWQLVIGILVLGAVLVLRGKGVPVTRKGLGFAVIIALIGTVVPNSTFYIAVRHLPAGIMSILIAMVPIIAFPVALALGNDRFSARRMLGILCGLAGVALIAAPGVSLPDPAMAVWLPVAIVGPICYAIEGNIVARWGTAGLDPVQAMFLASAVGALIVLPLMLASGQWISPLAPWGRAEAALILSSSIHALLYAGYVALAARAGAVFASQTSYIVTASGVLWSMALLGERFASGVWLAVAVMFAGLFLVAPRVKTARPDQPVTGGTAAV